MLAELISVERSSIFNRAIGRCLTGATGRIFGGQVSAQALSAAALFAEHQRPPQSLHSHFLRPGDPEREVFYDVTALKEGRSLSVLRVDAKQSNGESGETLILTATVSFHGHEESPEYQDVAPQTILPDECQPLTYVPAGTNTRVREPIDFRWPDPRSIGTEAIPPDQLIWFRAKQALPHDPVVHAAALTYISDLSLTRTAHQPLRSTAFSRIGASLDHNLWFHRDFRADEWMLFDQHTSTYFGARSMSSGKVYTEEGALCAYVNQEALIRPQYS
jgi:acyl-CoA thioesterase II